ncbi:uncharacterized protein LY89DRAFT_617425 [Mollisia scopiformis]|uniref:Zn(2)-C6 fungal-type domain-containing protein n=1 Tax=Mollisia scopiformis TaxID=149040 RepID=A0A194X849_MOLSC|nr:uncharacterized protein LY89DRAFT_617425 [Mollisia scopiformis]KUJ16289.1 hypothetical protein LY89DRAFT_617425 [Mollisia scopiformis]
MNRKGQPGQTKKRNRVTVACTECHRRKQKCDRAEPCSDCQERGVPQKCQYQKPKVEQESAPKVAGKTVVSRFRRIMSGEEVIMTSESVAALADPMSVSALVPTSEPVIIPYATDLRSQECLDSLRTRPSGYAFTTRPVPATVASGLNYNNSLNNYDPFSILPDIKGEPLPKQILIRYYVERLAPWLCNLDDRFRGVDDLEIIPVPKIAWLGYAVEHTAFYYATLLTAAVHLNRRRKLKDPGALIWYKVHTIQLANEKMNVAEEAASDEMIMTALVLCYFNVGGNNVDEYEIHLRGIDQMLKVQGGKEATGMRGMVKNWLGVSHGPWSPGFEYGAFVKDT